ncbi:MAG: hypothetical protein N4A46_16635 [Schleiferiaceae bacterium]|jgi:hypothetical protein|nr:hypothetical protein [Schleiferiaceae bacterium]
MLQKLFLIFLSSTVLFSCTAPSFYEKSYDFNKNIATGHFDEAEKMLEDNKDKLEDSKIRFLYFVNGGLVEHLKGNFELSNEFFEKADLFVEDERKNGLEQGAAFLLNPNISTYYGEDHEILMINYYKALNYYMMNDHDDALVEVRRLNLRLQSLSEKYSDSAKYKEDAFMHALMGMIYESNNDHNNAFIAYRNAYKIYESDYQEMFEMGAPLQLKKDLIRSAYRAGMNEERRFYEKKFNESYDPKTEGNTSVLLLWNNGMGPVKEEWGINFAIVYTGGGWVNFVSKEYGLSFPFYVGDTDLYGLTWIKVVFPRYVTRNMLFDRAEVKIGENTYPLELAEDLDAISFKVLNERMLAEFAKSLLRVALKQVAAYKVGDNNDSPALGATLSFLASATESADTRNWQTLPHSIYYKRVPVEPGKTTMEFTLFGEKTNPEPHTLEVDVKAGQTLIYPFYSLGAYEPATLNRAK